MGVIALLTDYGLKDPYVARIKGKLLSIAPEIQCVDVSHEIDKYHLPQAAYVLGNVWREFPEGSVFLVGVEHPYEQSDYIISEAEGRFFVSPNNGLLSLLLDSNMVSALSFKSVTKIDSIQPSSFVLFNELLEIAVDLIQGKSMTIFGQSIDDIKRFTVDEVKIQDNELTGKVLYVDSYGNIITNIHKDIIEVNASGNAYEVRVGREYISRISEGYQVGVEARCVAFFNVDGFLEIAITDAKASELLGVKGESSLKFDKKIQTASEELGIKYDSPVSVIISTQQQPLL